MPDVLIDHEPEEIIITEAAQGLAARQVRTARASASQAAWPFTPTCQAAWARLTRAMAIWCRPMVCCTSGAALSFLPTVAVWPLRSTVATKARTISTRASGSTLPGWQPWSTARPHLRATRAIQRGDPNQVGTPELGAPGAIHGAVADMFPDTGRARSTC